MEFYQYPKCGTCKKAAKYLSDHGCAVISHHIVEETPTKAQLLTWMDQSGLEVRKFFNTSGKVYQEMGLKDRVGTITKEEAADLLSSNGMLIKRPILVNGDQVLVGFKAKDYEELVSKC